MPKLIELSERREAFAQNVAKGMTLRESAQTAGYSPARAQVTGSNLAKDRNVQARIAELKQALTERVTHQLATYIRYNVQDAMREANEAWEMAKERNNPAHMLMATRQKCDIMGIVTSKQEVRVKDVTEMTDSELDAIIQGQGQTIEHLQ